MKKVQATQARNKFQDVIDQVHYTQKSTVICKRGNPWVIISPIEKKIK